MTAPLALAPTQASLAAALAEHGPSGVVSSREGWIGCECGARLSVVSGLDSDGYSVSMEEEAAAWADHRATALIASGVLRAADSLPGDSALVEAVAAVEHVLSEWCDTMKGDSVRFGVARGMALEVRFALAAALVKP